MQIPAKVKVGSGNYRVVLCDKHPLKDTSASCHYTERKIVIATKHSKTNVSYKREYVLDSFVHELTHAILDEMGSPLSRNEKFVSEFATLMTKALFPKERTCHKN